MAATVPDYRMVRGILDRNFPYGASYHGSFSQDRRFFFAVSGHTIVSGKRRLQPGHTLDLDDHRSQEANPRIDLTDCAGRTNGLFSANIFTFEINQEA